MVYSFQELIRFILDGQNVDAATINRVLRDLDNNTRYLKETMDGALLSEAIFDREVTCEADLLVGMPAYYNNATQRYERAKAVTYIDDGLMKIADSSYPWGVCSFKHNSTKCDLLLFGVATIDISAAIPDDDMNGDQPIPGVYYLSGTTAGMMHRSPAPVSVPVAQVGPDGVVYVRPNLADIFTRHLHFRYGLKCLPSGTASLGGGRWSIGSPNANLEGWLPAGHSSFAGKAPSGAVFGYNLAAGGLGAIWPPLPLEGVHIDWDRGIDLDVGGTTVPLGRDGLVMVDENGIWWMSNCQDDVPWPSTVNSPTSTTTTTNVPECPRITKMQMTLFFTKPVYQTTDTVVTSLETDSPIISITCASDGQPASTGPLVINVDFNLAVQTPMVAPGCIVLKHLNPDGTILAGPVIEALKSGTSTLQIVSDQPDLEDGYKVGKCTLSVTPSPLGGELPVIEVKLMGATLEGYEDVMSLGLPNGRDSGFRGEYHIPKALAGTTVNTRLRFWILGRVDGTLPMLELTARALTQPGEAPASVALDVNDDPVSIATDHVITQDHYIEVESNDIPGSPGAAIQFTLSRKAEANDGYGGDILIIKRLAVISSTT